MSHARHVSYSLFCVLYIRGCWAFSLRDLCIHFVFMLRWKNQLTDDADVWWRAFYVGFMFLWAPALIWHQVLLGFKQNPSCFSEERFSFQLWRLFSWRYRNKKQLTESDPPCSDKSAASCNQTVSEITFHFVSMFSCYSCSLPHIVPDWNVSQAWSQSSFPGSLMETGFVYFTDNQHMLAHTVTWEDPQDKPQQLTCCWLYMFVLSILNQVRD